MIQTQYDLKELTGDFLLECIQSYIEKHPFPKGLLCKKLELMTNLNNKKIEKMTELVNTIEGKSLIFESKIKEGKNTVQRKVIEIKRLLSSN